MSERDPLIAARDRLVLLDLYCGAGGAAMGYHRAGFEIVGVDINPQPNYPFEFIQDDALKHLRWLIAGSGGPYWLEDFAAIHASPPCQSFTAYRRKGHGVGDGYPDLIALTRELLEETGLPYVIENVPGAPLREPIRLCGSAFNLDVRRHRLFESNATLAAPRCDHASQVSRGKGFPGATNRDGRYTCEVGVWRIPLETQKQAMGVEWNVTLEELSEAIPPAYTEHIGVQLVARSSERRRDALSSIVRNDYPQGLRQKALDALLQEFGDEIGCCDEFPECAHVLATLAAGDRA